MGRFREETLNMSISFTTDGEIINRITGSNGDHMKSKEVMIAYLEQFCGVKVQKVNKQQLRQDIDAVIDKHLSYDRESN